MESICSNMSLRLAPPFSTQETVAAPQVAYASSDTSSKQAVIETTRKALLYKSTTSINTNSTTTETTNNFQSQNQRQPNRLIGRLLHQLRSTTASLQLVLFIFALLFVSHLTGCATATPLLSISSSGPSSKEIAEAGSSSNSISAGDKATAGEPSQLLDNSKQAKQAVGSLKTATNTAEKLKRGLTNFMNQLNAAPFFVPAIQPTAQPLPVQQQQQQQQQDTATLQSGLQVQENKTPQSSSAEPATIVTGDSSLVGLKGPANRWSFARPIGGPLRYGRR